MVCGRSWLGSKSWRRRLKQLGSWSVWRTKKQKNGGNEIVYSEAHQCLQLQIATKMLLSKSCGAARRLVLLYIFLDMTFLRKVDGVNSTSMVTLHGMMLGQCWMHLNKLQTFWCLCFLVFCLCRMLPMNIGRSTVATTMRATTTKVLTRLRRRCDFSSISSIKISKELFLCKPNYLS